MFRPSALVLSMTLTVLGGLALSSMNPPALARQEPPPAPTPPQEKKAEVPPAPTPPERKDEKLTKPKVPADPQGREVPPGQEGGVLDITIDQKGGKVIAPEEVEAQMLALKGTMLRPLVQEGGSGPEAPEEGTFTLRPGDMLELEAVFDKSKPAHIAIKVDKPEIASMIPAGVRRLIPAAMIGGEPRPITGMERVVAIFQAHEVGEAMITMNVVDKQFQYRIRVLEPSVAVD